MPQFFVKQETDNDPEAQSPEVGQDPLKILLSWTAPARPFKRKERSYFTTIAIIVILMALIALLAKEVLLIGVLLALTFVAYVLGVIPPENVEYKLSSQGVTVGDHFYHWQVLDSFWFSEKDGEKILHILTNLRFPGKLMLILGTQSEEEVKKVAARFLPFHEIAPKNFLDHWGENLQKYFPLENPHK